ncbi:SDR family oxidoreductase [Spirosoma agri]|uniref:dTDP-4-dehydrorhamnose reductase n=1 Tax=Spirosoma agri TaxID=1987381 RepID=A0A6M0IEP6_9BACT|nr:SDR family oxidoreductase [Spirosoma agri]NEU66756.1 SDR family oxidoreductase [Spirosoma agri]
MKRILITGANGFLGQKLVELLAHRPGIELVATARGNSRLSFSEGYTYHSMDITDRRAVLDLIASVRPHVVIHGAAMTDADKCEVQKNDCWKHNVHAVEYIIEACRGINAFLLHISTDFIFDGTGGPYIETAKANPISFYGWSKQAGEAALRHSGLRWAIARTMLVYGPASNLSRSNIILWVKKSLEEGKKISVVTDQWRSPTLVDDLAMGCYLIVDKEAEGVFHISGKEMLTPYDIAVKTATCFGLDTSLIDQATASTFTQRARRPPRTGFIVEKAHAVLGYNPHTFEEGMARLVSQTKDSIL